MIAPITVVELDDGSTWVLDTVRDAERFPEAIDVENNEYMAYDADGLLLRLVLDGKATRLVVASGRTEPDVLAIRLKNFLISCGVKLSVQGNESLEELFGLTVPFRTRYR